MTQALWQQCVHMLEQEIAPQQFKTWIKPLSLQVNAQGGFEVLAPNRFVKNWVQDKYLLRIKTCLQELSQETIKIFQIYQNGFYLLVCC